MKTLPLPHWLTPRNSISTASASSARLSPSPKIRRPVAVPGSVRTAARVSAPSAFQGGESRLLKNSLLRFDSRSGHGTVTVESGIVWVTAAPEDGDIILEAGESLRLRGGWPVVLQALSDSRIRLIPPLS